MARRHRVVASVQTLGERSGARRPRARAHRPRGRDGADRGEDGPPRRQRQARSVPQSSRRKRSTSTCVASAKVARATRARSCAKGSSPRSRSGTRSERM
jgi:hypothetical protein